MSYFFHKINNTIISGTYHTIVLGWRLTITLRLLSGHGTSNSKLFLQMMYEYVCWCSVNTATWSITVIYWSRSINLSQNWLNIHESTSTRLASNSWLIPACSLLIAGVSIVLFKSGIAFFSFFVLLALHIILQMHSAVIFLSDLKLLYVLLYFLSFF